MNNSAFPYQPLPLNRLLAVFLITCVFSPSCSLIDVGDSDRNPEVRPGVEAVYAGFYTQGFEDSIFEPCDLDEDWQLTGVAGDDSVVIDLVRRAGNLAGGGHNPVYVRLRGSASAKGTFPGIFITYDRTFALEEVETVRAIKAGDCR